MTENTESMEQLKSRCLSCTKCPLFEHRTHVVFGEGNPEADLMFVGEAPGEQEDLSGRPFVGRSGQLLDKYLEYVGISREEVFIANIIKCRPPANRDPNPREEDACIDYLRAQVRLIKPKIIVCLGRIAAFKLISPDYKMTSQHGTWVEKGDYLLTAVFHPAAILRDPRKKELMLNDMIEIARKLGRGQ